MKKTTPFQLSWCVMKKTTDVCRTKKQRVNRAHRISIWYLHNPLEHAAEVPFSMITKKKYQG